ncbi:terpene cyclase/mutase family protein [Opitutales bacterium]|nr:terpene cyclase/mutase family protein [Opitutales bacterium]
MTVKSLLSLLLSTTLGLAVVGNLFAGHLITASILVFIGLGVGVLSHLAFFEEKKKKPAGIGPIPWLNLVMCYSTLLLGLGSFLFLLINPSDPREMTIAKAGQSAGQETEGSKVPISDETNVASGGERARLGNSGRGEGLDAMGGANEDNQNAMREAQVANPDIAGAEQGMADKTKVSSQNFEEVVNPSELDQGIAGAEDFLLSRIGEDQENKDIGDPNALVFDENEDSALAFDPTVFRGAEDPNDILSKANGDKITNLRAAVNSLGVSVPKSMSGRCDKVGRVARLARGGVRNPERVENAVTKALNWLSQDQNADGSWGKNSKGAMTGFALLCYLGHCDLTDSPEYGETVAKGIKYLVELGDEKDGWLYVTNHKHGSAYAHGIASYALAEAYGMTEKAFILPVLQKAIRRIIVGQQADGGWVYMVERPGADNLRLVDFGNKGASDTSVSGWQFQALKAAYNTGANFPDIEPALELAVKNFYRVYSSENGGFGYRNKSDTKKANHKLTGVGSLGLQSWKFGHPSEEEKKETLKKAMQHILKNNLSMDYNSGDANLYSWYYDAQALFNYGGAFWTAWNRKMEPMLLNSQLADGSWPKEGGGKTSSQGGKDAEVYRTTLCILMLEVYYRYVY